MGLFRNLGPWRKKKYLKKNVLGNFQISENLVSNKEDSFNQ